MSFVEYELCWAIAWEKTDKPQSGFFTCHIFHLGDISVRELQETLFRLKEMKQACRDCIRVLSLSSWELI